MLLKLEYPTKLKGNKMHYTYITKNFGNSVWIFCSLGFSFYKSIKSNNITLKHKIFNCFWRQDVRTEVRKIKINSICSTIFNSANKNKKRKKKTEGLYHIVLHK